MNTPICILKSSSIILHYLSKDILMSQPITAAVRDFCTCEFLPQCSVHIRADGTREDTSGVSLLRQRFPKKPQKSNVIFAVAHSLPARGTKKPRVKYLSHVTESLQDLPTGFSVCVQPHTSCNRMEQQDVFGPAVLPPDHELPGNNQPVWPGARLSLSSLNTTSRPAGRPDGCFS